MYRDNVAELLHLYDDLRTRSNSGSWDDWFMAKFRLKRMLNWKPYEKFYQRTYTHPFAKQRFYKEIQFDLLELRELFRILNARKGNNDFDLSESLKMIDNYLEKISQVKKKKKKGIVMKVLGSSLLASVIIPIMASLEQFYPIILILAVMLGLQLGTWYMADRTFLFIVEKLWYRTCQQKLGIYKLRNRLTDKLIAEIHT